FHKNNYGPISESITLRYQNGLFIPITASTADAAAREAEAEHVFLSVLCKMTNQGQDLSPNKYAHASYAPAMIADHPDAGGFRKREMEAAMQRLLERDKVHIKETGPRSKQRKHLAAGPRRLV